MCVIAAKCPEKSEYNFKVVEELPVLPYVFSYVGIPLLGFNND